MSEGLPASATREGEVAAPLRGSRIRASLAHDAGAYARCSWCSRYSDDLRALTTERWPCDCGKLHGWTGSFARPTEKAIWSEAKK